MWIISSSAHIKTEKDEDTDLLNVWNRFSIQPMLVHIKNLKLYHLCSFSTYITCFSSLSIRNDTNNKVLFQSSSEWQVLNKFRTKVKTNLRSHKKMRSSPASKIWSIEKYNKIFLLLFTFFVSYILLHPNISHLFIIFPS